MDLRYGYSWIFTEDGWPRFFDLLCNNVVIMVKYNMSYLCLFLVFFWVWLKTIWPPKRMVSPSLWGHWCPNFCPELLRVRNHTIAAGWFYDCAHQPGFDWAHPLRNTVTCRGLWTANIFHHIPTWCAILAKPSKSVLKCIEAGSLVLSSLNRLEMAPWLDRKKSDTNHK